MILIVYYAVEIWLKMWKKKIVDRSCWEMASSTAGGSGWYKGKVKAVLSGDCLVIMAVAANRVGPPPEKTLTLSSLIAPRLVLPSFTFELLLSVLPVLFYLFLNSCLRLNRSASVCVRAQLDYFVSCPFSSVISFFPLWFVSVNYHSKLWNQKSICVIVIWVIKNQNLFILLKCLWSWVFRFVGTSVLVPFNTQSISL